MYNNFSNKSRSNNKPKTSNKKNTYQKNLSVEVPVSSLGITKGGKSFDAMSFIDMLNDLQDNKVFSKISIPVYMEFSYISGNPDNDWNVIVGFIKYFNSSANAGVTIYKRSIDAFNKIKDPVIVPRVTLNEDGTVRTIIGLDIIEHSRISAFIEY